MEARYRTLQAIYAIVKDDADPTTYPCTYRELILKGLPDTSSIQEHLDQLAEEEFIILKMLERLVICITARGIEKAREFLSVSRKN
jgi:UDP-N-acetylmuramyl tripeptide synthase